MRAVKTKNMTEGKPLLLLAVFALPLLLGNLFQQAYNLADTMIVGKLLGKDALAAVGATGSVSFLFFSVSNGIGSGGGIVTAQLFGAGKKDDVKRAIVNSAYIMFTAALVMGSVAFALVPTVLRFMGTPADILPDSITYMRMTCASVPLVAVYNYAASMQRALGDSRTPLYFLIVASVMNVGMDFLFVGVFGMGVFGAALATMLSQLLAGVGSLLYAVKTNEYFRIDREHMRFDAAISKRAVRLGIPLALQWSMIAISTTALQRVVNTFGTVAIAAYTATGRLEQLVQQPYGSMSMALSNYSGQNIGAGKPERIREGLRQSLAAVGAFSLLMFAVMQIFGNNLIGMFVKEADVIEMGGRALRITSFFYLFLGLIYVTRGTLNGVGDAFFSFVNGIVEMVGRICLPIIMLGYTDIGVWCIWLTAGLTWMLAGISCVLRYRSWVVRKSGLVSAGKENRFPRKKDRAGQVA
ncbi:MAG: MATE family efflux transporter [Lachnospiraceae bacterium]|nr:MATE family efflux transporter [Lachnospiraceae bacterium]